MTTLLQTPRMGDVILQEERNYYSRRVCQIAPSQTLFFGQVLQGDPINGQLSALAADLTTAANNEVRALVMVNSDSDVGTFTLTIEGHTTGSITANATPATQVTNINTALDTMTTTLGLGNTQIVCSGASLAALILTFSGSGYQNRPINGVYSTVLTHATGSSLTINGVGAGTAAAVTPAPTTTVGTAAGAGRNQIDTITMATTAFPIVVTDYLGLKIQQPNGVYLPVTAICTTDIATWVTAINAAIVTAFGSAQVVVATTGGSWTTNATLTITYSGTNYRYRPVTEDVQLDVSRVTSALTWVRTTTTPGLRPAGASSSSATAVLLYDGVDSTVALTAAAAAIGTPIVVTDANTSKWAVCLVRHCMVKPGYLKYQPSTAAATYGVEGASVADQKAAIAALAAKGILVETGPTYTTSPDA